MRWVRSEPLFSAGYRWPRSSDDAPFVQDVTQDIASRYANVLDQVGERYYTRERFDDFYPGKGSPILTCTEELAFWSSKVRHVDCCINMVQRFDALINDHESTAIECRVVGGVGGTPSIVTDLPTGFLSHPAQGSLAQQPAGYAVELSKDRRVVDEFLTFLERHRIVAYQLAGDWSIEGKKLDSKRWWILPSDQQQGLFLNAIMERRTEFPFDTFYDVSAWNMADAFGLDWIRLASPIPADIVSRVLPVLCLNGTQ